MVALPWLEALAPRVAGAQTVAPKRIIPMFFPNGRAFFWNPSTAGVGAAWQLSPILEPLQPVKEKTIVLSNLQSYTACVGSDGLIVPTVNPSHARLPGTTLTCVDGDQVRDDIRDATGTRPEFANGISMDQLIVQTKTPETVLPSMQVGLSTFQSYCDGRHCSYSQSISWSAPEQPMYKDVNPQTVFDRLVTAGATDREGGVVASDPAVLEAAARRNRLKLSVLDGVTKSANALKPNLTYSDNVRLEQFLTSLREIETRVAAVANSMGQPTSTLGCNLTARPGFPAAYDLQNGDIPVGGSTPYDKEAHADVMNDLVVMALECDVTRIITYMLDDARSEFVYNHVPQREFTDTGSTVGGGTAGNFHGSQHAGERNNGFASINHWLTQKVSSLAQKMDAIPEGTGTLLDNSVIIYMSPMEGGNHAGYNLPFVMIGGAGGVLRTNQHIVFPPPVAAENDETATGNDRAVRDVYFTLMNQYFDMGLTSFGNENRPGISNELMTEILA